jgi:hypothetical protein
MALLPPGADVRAELQEGGSTRGIFVAADEQSITLRVDAADRVLPREQVRRVSMAAGTHYKRHVNLGALAGVALGAVFLERRCAGEPISSACYEEAMLYVGLPAMAGAGVGHLLPKGVTWRQVYVRPVEK